MDDVLVLVDTNYDFSCVTRYKNYHFVSKISDKDVKKIKSKTNYSKKKDNLISTYKNNKRKR